MNEPKLEINESVKLGEAEIKVAIAEWLERKFNKKFEVSINASKVCRGYGTAEYDETIVSATGHRKTSV